MNKIYTGKVRVSHKKKGFFNTDDFEKSIIVETENLGGALDLDLVEISFLKNNSYGDPLGKVEKIISRNKDLHVGKLIKSFNPKTRKKELIFTPDNYRFYPDVEFQNLEKFEKAEEGYKVSIKIEDYKNSDSLAKAEIIEILGKAGKNETEMKAAVLEAGLPFYFPEEVEKEAEEIKKNSSKIIEEEKKNRKDLTHLNVFTIDPADAKDFDDALSVEKLDDGNFRVGIHIADPSFFVKKNSLLEKEAQKRATSIYLVDRTIPMLPEVLSNDLCSLNPNEEKLTFSVLVTLSAEAKILKTELVNSFVVSKKRFDYLGAQKILDEKNGDFLEDLQILENLADNLEKQKKKGGSIEFSSVEVKFKLDEEKFPVGVFVKKRVRTMEIIEEFMLLANKEISKYASLSSSGEELSRAFIYRIHDKPKQERITELISFLSDLGEKVDEDEDGNLSSHEINKILKKFKDHPLEDLISLSILRSMQKAVYSTNNIGHFGLGFKYYSHFTSPIRRYPDMIAHRLLRDYLQGLNHDQKKEAEISALAEHSSEMEAKAVTAERASILFKQTQYYSVRVSEEFSGMVVGVNKFGIFVENIQTKTTGTLSVRDIYGDFFEFNEKKRELVGKNTKRKFKLGDKIKAKIKEVDIENRKINLTLK